MLSPQNLLFALPLTLTLFTGVDASPFIPRQLQEGPNCTLNAMGKGVCIQLNDPGYHPFIELGVPAAPQAGTILRSLGNTVYGYEAPDFHLQQNGQAVPSYIIKDFSNNNLALAFLGRRTGSRPTYQPASDSGTDTTQLWDFACGYCDPNAALHQDSTGAVLGGNCMMHPHNTPDLCVQIAFDANESPFPVVWDCDATNQEQFFNIVL